MDKLRQYNNLKNDITISKHDIEKYCFYKYEDIIPIIVKLINAFEDCNATERYLYDNDGSEYAVIDIDKERRFILPTIQHIFLKDSDDYCFLPPKKYKNLDNFKNFKYIQNFVDYLFDERKNGNIKNVDINILNYILNNYLKIQGKRISEDKKEVSINRCKVDRLAIYRSIINIVNSYSSKNAVATYNSIQDEKLNNDETKTFTLTQELIVKVKNIIAKFEVEVDTITVGEEDFQNVSLNKNTKTIISYSDLDKELNKVYKHLPELKLFMCSIKKIFSSKNYILNEDQINEVERETILTLNKKPM